MGSPKLKKDRWILVENGIETEETGICIEMGAAMMKICLKIGKELGWEL